MAKSLTHNKKGFTIVELLIVVVVIAILAAISIVAYTGIANRANDSAVQADLKNFASLIMKHQVDEGQYPAGYVALGGGSGFGAISGLDPYPFARSAYSTEANNIYYCEGGGRFAVGATSKSEKRFYYRSDGGMSEYTGSWTNANSICPGMIGTVSPTTQSYGFRSSDGAWSPMTK